MIRCSRTLTLAAPAALLIALSIPQVHARASADPSAPKTAPAPETASPPPAPPEPSVELKVAVLSYGTGAVSSADLKGTALAPGAVGTLKVSAKNGSVRLSMSVRSLLDATSFGPSYLTYVVWAVTPEGLPNNLGQMFVKNGKGKFQVTTQIPAFGLLVTAEPYFAVAVPSELAVLRNTFNEEERAVPSEAVFKTFPRDTFSGDGAKAPDPKADTPLDLYQARNAVRIAKAFGAETYASDALTRAGQLLLQAEAFALDKRNRKLAAPKAREAVQAADTARNLATRKIEEARIADEKVRAAARAAAAQAEAREAQTRAEEAQVRADAAQAEAGAAHARAVEAQTVAEQEAKRRAAAEAEKHALREKLLQQFNLILETRDSARGLIVSLGDVLFDVDKYTLRPEARERLAKLSGIVLGNPGLKLEVEGHTDSTGSDDYNQKLSENRAGAVRDYLVAQNVPADSVTARGYGKTRPVAPNDTAAGRQKNRRVEIVVSGDIIGTGETPAPETQPEPSGP
jgi:outer membrane protein OmpA-like peptidoglycan-associated protein